MCVCARAHTCMCMLGTEPIAEPTPPPLLPAPSLQVFPRLTCLLRVLSKQNQIDAAVLPSLPLTHIHHVMKPQRKTYIHTGELPLTKKKISLISSIPLLTSLSCLTEGGRGRGRGVLSRCTFMPHRPILLTQH